MEGAEIVSRESGHRKHKDILPLPYQIRDLLVGSLDGYPASNAKNAMRHPFMYNTFI